MGRKPAGSLCLVAVELDHLVRNGGIGTTNWHLVHLLAQHGWHVHILYGYPLADVKELPVVRRRLASVGIGLTHLDEVRLPSEFELNDPAEPYFLRISDRVCCALRELHRQHHFDLVEFAETVGLGFRPLQAKRSGLDFADIGMIVKLHSMAKWLRSGNQVWMSYCQDLLLDFCEQQAFEQADFQVSPSHYLLDYAGQIGWRVRPDASIVRYPFPPPEHSAPQWPAGLNTELVFFGRLEPRKGLDLFLDALRELPGCQPVAFLGKDTELDCGMRASDYIRCRLRGRSAPMLLTNYDREQAVRFLANGNRLAILPSLVENYANAVIECVVNGIPFLASRVGGTPEIVPEDLQPHLLFDPTSADLARAVNRYLDAPEDLRCQWRERLQAATDVDQHNRQVVACYEAMLAQQRQRGAGPAPRPPGRPRVAVVVHYTNQAAVLPLLLHSLAEQTYPNLEIHVVADQGDTVFTEMERRYGAFLFMQGVGTGSSVRNRILAETAAPLFLPLTADIVLRPTMIEHLVKALELQPECSAMIGYVQKHPQPSQPGGKSLAGARRPSGGPWIMGCLLNVWSESCGLFRTESLRNSGGFLEPAANGIESDWPTYVRLARAGRSIGVLPEHVGDYYQRPGRSAGMLYAIHQQVLELYARATDLSESERHALLTALVSVHKQQSDLLRQESQREQPLRHRLADRANTLLKKVPLLHPAGRAMAMTGLSAWQFLRGAGRSALNSRPATHEW